jgi:hypothetical protein
MSTSGYAATLLVEFGHEFGMGGNPPPLPTTVPFEVQAYEENIFFPTSVYFTWVNQYSVADVGKTFLAPAGIHEGVNLALDSPTATFELQSGAFGHSTRRLSEHPPGGECIGPNRTCVFVENPAIYYVTAVERTITKLVIDPNFGLIQGAQTVRIFGEPVPPLAGDFNQNGRVDAGDYVVWRDRVATHEFMPNGTGEGLFEGRAVEGDYNFWRANFGRTSLPAAVQFVPHSVPEPTTRAGGLLLVSALVICSPRQLTVVRRRSREQRCLPYPNHPGPG